jgi:hypothetical protein
MEDTNKLLSAIQHQIDAAEQAMAHAFGMEFYKSDSGFLPSQIYKYVGKNDGVATLLFRHDSDMFKMYGSSLTVSFVYTQLERKALETDLKAFDETNKVKARNLLPNAESDNSEEFQKDGIDIRDIIEITVVSLTPKNNTFACEELRTPNMLEIPFEAEGGGKDFGWMYGALCRFLSDGIALTTDEYAQYLAYKCILYKESLSEEEKRVIFDDKGRICNNEVSYYYLQWRKEAGKLKDDQLDMLARIERIHLSERLVILDTELQKIGLNLKKFAEKYPKKAGLLFEKTLKFHEVRYNVTGKHLLCLNYESFLHVYLRHVEELKVDNQFADRDKFQLKEEDVLTVIGVVMRVLNDEYQKYKDEHPDGRFFRAGKMAYYYNGDYYHVDVNPDGSISTFYKANRNMV